MPKYNAEIEITNVVVSGKQSYVQGHIYNDKHGRFVDGDHVNTSIVSLIDFENGYIYTKNSTYKIREADLWNIHSR